MNLPKRESNRLRDYNYSKDGCYFVTICVKDRRKTLSKVAVVGTPVPTNEIVDFDNKNSTISKFVSTFKRFYDKEYGENIWQSRYYDHIVRNQQDYNEICNYINNNPMRWILKHNKTQDG